MVDEAPTRPRTLLLDLSAVPQIDSTAVEVFADFAGRLEAEGTGLWLAAMTTSVLEVSKAAPHWSDLRTGRMIFPTLAEAVGAYISASNPQIRDQRHPGEHT
jgi:MFS superfamily sulfate permease-like transporter